MAAGSTLGAIFLLYLTLLLMTPLRLLIADRFDRSHRGGAMLVSCLLLLCSGYPAFMLLDANPGPLTLFLLPVSLQFIGLFYLSPLQAFMGMVFTIRRRGIGLSVAYSMGVAIFGGFAPFINEWLVTKTGDPRIPGMYLGFTAVVTMIALLFAGRRIARKSQ
jgi:MHS family proline/betaine transporter-like MFS transporter